MKKIKLESLKDKDFEKGSKILIDAGYIQYDYKEDNKDDSVTLVIYYQLFDKHDMTTLDSISYTKYMSKKKREGYMPIYKDISANFQRLDDDLNVLEEVPAKCEGINPMYYCNW